MKNAQLTLLPDPNEQNATITLEGELVLTNGKEIQSELLRLLPQFESLTLQLINVEALDLAFLQVLHGLQRSARERNKKVTISHTLPPDIQSLLVATGLDQIQK